MKRVILIATLATSLTYLQLSPSHLVCRASPQIWSCRCPPHTQFWRREYVFCSVNVYLLQKGCYQYHVTSELRLDVQVRYPFGVLVWHWSGKADLPVQLCDRLCLHLTQHHEQPIMECMFGSKSLSRIMVGTSELLVVWYTLYTCVFNI